MQLQAQLTIAESDGMGYLGVAVLGVAVLGTVVLQPGTRWVQSRYKGGTKPVQSRYKVVQAGSKPVPAGTNVVQGWYKGLAVLQP